MSESEDNGNHNIILRCVTSAGQRHDFLVPSFEQPATELVLAKGALHFRAAAWRPERDNVNDVLCQFREFTISNVTTRVKVLIDA